MSTPIELLEARVRERYPDAVTAMDANPNPEGSWWLDVRVRGEELTLEWRRSVGFGVNARPDALFGELSDEVYYTLDETWARVQELIETGGRTEAPRTMTLSELLRRRNLSDEEAAQFLRWERAAQQGDAPTHAA